MEDIKNYQWKSFAKNSSLEEGLKYVKKSCKLTSGLANECRFRTERDAALAYAFYELEVSRKKDEQLEILKKQSIFSLTTLMCKDFLKYNELLYEQVLAGEKKARDYLKTKKISSEDEKNLRPFLAGNSREV